MIDPLERWRALGLADKPDYAGLLTFAGMPYTQDPAELAGVDAAIVGAPTDDLVSDRPGTRFAPRAIRAASCPPGPHLEAGIDAFAELCVVDFGDAAVIPADPERTHTAIEALVGQVAEAGPTPVVLGGDHSIAEPDIGAVASVHGPVGLIHFDTHTDTGTEVFGVERSHGTPMYRLVEQATSTRAVTFRSASAATGRGRRSSIGRRNAGSRASSWTRCANSGSASSSSARWRASVPARSSSRSTWTCSIRPSHPGRALPSPAG